ncbi:flippase-like domain-containing protein, partial [Candidatus Babeliales bacterium]|nr:flippase-like domain-containing protein [Candidatus Babeliales bacterium]
LVNDNSIDNTPFIIDDFARNNSCIKAVHRTDTPGFGNAIKTGFKHATGDVIIPVMGDLSDDPRDIPKLVKKIEEGYDVVYGSRFIEGGTIDVYPTAKMFANRLFNNVVRLLFGMRQKDVTNAFKAYRKEVLDEIGDIEASGFDLTVEIPMKAHILGFKSTEVPVAWHGRERGEANLKLSKNASLYGKRLLKMFVWGNLVSLRDLFGAVVRGSWIGVLLAILLGLFILAGLFTISGFSEIFGIIKNISFFWFLLSCGAIFSTFIIRTWRWSVLLRTAGYVFPRDMIFKCIMFGWLLNYLLPARVGDVARAVALKTTERAPLGMSLSTIVLERAIDMVTLAFLLGISTALFFPEKFLMLEVIAIGIALALILLLFLIYKFDYLIVNKLKNRFSSIKESVHLLKQGLDELYKNPEAIALCLLLSIPIWLFEISSIYFASKAINFNLSFPFATVSGIAAFIAQVLPLTPAGIGIHEGSITGVLALFGISTEIGTSIALVDHFARGIIIYTFGLISAIHIGFASREYFVELKNKKVKEVREGE